MCQPCSQCHGKLRLIGEDRGERLEVIPAELKVVEEVCHKYACPCSVHTAGKPAQPLPKSIASASLLAQVITEKLLYHSPLHRQEQKWRAQGVTLSRKTMSGGWRKWRIYWGRCTKNSSGSCSARRCTADTLMSFVATCRRLGIDAFAWFRDVLTRIAQGHPVNRLAELLPHCWKPLSI